MISLTSRQSPCLAQTQGPHLFQGVFSLRITGVFWVVNKLGHPVSEQVPNLLYPITGELADHVVSQLADLLNTL